MTIIEEVSTETTVNELRQSDAVLLILQALQRTEAGVTHRLVLEGMASVAGLPDFGGKGCRILSVFDNRSWHRRLYEALAHLEHSGCVRTSVEGYRLTGFAQSRLDGLELSDVESERIRDLANKVRQNLSLR